jgi:cardiolipin synthase
LQLCADGSFGLAPVRAKARHKLASKPGPQQGAQMVLYFRSLPNLISLGRLLLAPTIVALIASQQWKQACVVFVIAGISDAVDGWLAKTFNLRSELGSYLDPLADKALVVSIYVALAIASVLPATIAILVVARDVMIVGAFMISLVMQKPMKVKPLMISKINTAAQISFAAIVLGAKAFDVAPGVWFDVFLYAVAALTLGSTGAYLNQWIKHMNF